MSSAPKYAPRRELDAYYTEDRLARALVSLVPVRGLVLEPHVGGGAFARAVRDQAERLGWPTVITGRDISPTAEGFADCDRMQIGDFLEQRDPWDWVVGNPPYRGFEAHVDHALTLAPRVAFLLRLAVLESAARIPCWQRWPLRKVWVLAERPSFTGNGKTDSAAYGWFYFERGYTGAAEVVPGWSWK